MQVGVVLLNVNYWVGYIKVEMLSFMNMLMGLQWFDYYDDLIGYQVNVSVGFVLGMLLLVGLIVSGLYDCEIVSQFSQCYEGYYGCGDVLLLLLGYFVLIVGVGYEKIEMSQKDVLVDIIGVLVFDGDGCFVIVLGLL